MKRLALILLASCSTQAPDDYPIQPGGGGALPPVQNDAGMVKGRACLVTDARDLTSCATTGAEGLAVQLGDEVVMTEADGGFAIRAPDGGSPSLAMLGITGTGVVPTQVAVPDGAGQGAMSIPLLKADLFAQMMAANGITSATGSGSILGRVARGGSPLSGVSVSSTPT
ncbi:MAG: hypothetical protein H7138_13710, partial [Myxococcales bacterium]|nr:hypothetical protein [Myxococcales bacterium]